MSEKLNVTVQERAETSDTLEESIRKMLASIEEELPEKIPPVDIFFKNHPNYTGEVSEFLESYYGNNLRSLRDDTFRDVPNQNFFKGEYEWVGNKLDEIVQDYKKSLLSYDVEQERLVYKKYLAFGGEKFEDIHINRLIKYLYDFECGNCDEFSVHDKKIPSPSTFNDEWRRFYQTLQTIYPNFTHLIRGLLLSPISEITSPVFDKIQENNDDEIINENYPFKYDITDSIDENILLEVYDHLDAYFEIDTLNPEFVISIIDLLYQHTQVNKSNWEEHDDNDPRFQIDKLIYELHDSGCEADESLFLEYVYQRLIPKVKTHFGQFKLDAALSQWEITNSHYTDNNDITLSSDAYRRLNGGRMSDIRADLRYSTDKPTMELLMTDGYLAMYFNNDGFLPFKKTPGGEGVRVEIKDMLLAGGIESSYITNENISIYRSLMDLRVRAELEEQLGFSLSVFNVRQQIALLEFMKKCTREDFDALMKELNTYDAEKKQKICTIFLVTEGGALKLHEMQRFLNHPSADQLLDSMYELLGQTEAIEQYLHEQTDVAYERQDISAIYTRLIERVRSILLKYGSQDISDKESVQTAETETNNLQASQNLLLAALRTLNKSEKIFNLTSIKDIDTEQHVPAQNISIEDRETMIQLYNENYRNNESLRQSLMVGFNNLFTDNRERANRFFLLHHKDVTSKKKLRAFYRLETKDDGHLYFGSFNVDPSYQGSSLGDLILQQSLTKESSAPGTVIEADCEQVSPIACKYIEHGFIGTEQYDYAGTPSLKIWRNDALHQELFPSSYWSEEEIISKAEIGEERRIDANTLIVAHPIETIQHMPFHYLNHNMSKEKVVLTRYFRRANPDNNQQILVYAVFEQISQNALSRYMSPLHQTESMIEEDTRLAA